MSHLTLSKPGNRAAADPLRTTVRAPPEPEAFPGQALPDLRVVPVLQVVPELPGIVLLSHGSAALGILESVRLIYPEQPNLAALSLDMGDDTEEFYRKLEKLYQAFHGNCIFFADFNGGTPCNQLRIFQIRNKVQVFGALGFSIPMVLSAIDSRRDGLSPEEIAGHAIKDGHEGIQGLCMENVQCCEED